MSDDLIKRSDAIKAIDECYALLARLRLTAKRALETVPSADRPQGEWVPFEYGDDTWHKCSVCGVADKYRGSMPRPNGTIGEWEYVRNYCPNCGARMKGADDE